jgi:putative membrane protein
MLVRRRLPRFSSLKAPSRRGAAKSTDPQIAHIAYTAGVIDVAATKQALAKSGEMAVRAFAERKF